MKRSAPLRRSTPLRARKPMRKRKPKDDGKRDPAYLAWIRKQPCAAAYGYGYECSGPVHAHHATAGRGLGQKTHDHTAVPLCALHHERFHRALPPFSDKAHRASWMAHWAAVHREIYARPRREPCAF